MQQSKMQSFETLQLWLQVIESELSYLERRCLKAYFNQLEDIKLSFEHVLKAIETKSNFKNSHAEIIANRLKAKFESHPRNDRAA